MKRVLIIIGAIVLIFLGVYLIVRFSPFQEKVKVSTGPINGTFYSVATSGGNNTCTWEENETGSVTKGTIYISGKNFRANMQTTAGNISLNNYFLGNGEKLYVWSDLDSTNGSIIEYKKFKNPTGKNGIYNTQRTYTCAPGVPNESAFEIPKNITFK